MAVGRGTPDAAVWTLTPGTVVDRSGEELGHVAAVELVTVGQRRGLGLPGGTAPRYVVDVDVAARRVVVGDRADLLVDAQEVESLRWSAGVAHGPLDVQCSAHGAPQPASIELLGGGRAWVRWSVPQRRVAPGQSVVAYVGDEVVAGAIAAPG